MGALDKARPGRENAKDWLTVKIVECLSAPMDESAAGKLNAYGGAYNILKEWSSGEGSPFTRSEADAWTRRMENEDGTEGPHWTFEQAKEIMEERGLSLDPVQFWAALCMIYSDYSSVAIKHKVGGNIEFYVDMAKAFLNDRDAPKDKLARYYRDIVSA